MSAEELLTTAAGNQVEENTKDQLEPEDKKGLMDEIMEVISRGSASEEERQSTPSAVERPADQEEHQIDDANEEVKRCGEEESTEVKDDDTSATQEAREPPPAEEEAQAAGEEEEKSSEQADTAASTDVANAGEAPVAGEEEPKDEPKVEDGEGEPSAADKPAEPEDVATPPVDVTVSYLISTEDALAKGIAEEDVERFKQYHLKTKFGIQSWYQSLKEHTFETEFINLSNKQVEVLAAAAHPFSDAPELNEEQQEVLSKLEEEIDAALEKFGDAGAFIKLDTCSGKDSVLDRNDADHIQDIKDSVVNEMEIEKQFANAYLIWRSWRSSSFRRSSTANSSEAQEGRLRRSFRRIQKTFNRPRAQTTSLQASKENEAPKNEDALAEVTPKKEEEEKKEEEVKEDKPEAEADKSGDSKGEEETKKDEEPAKSEEEPAAAIIVEATIETEVEPKGTEPTDTVEQKVDEEDKKEEASPPAQNDAPSAAAAEEDGEKKEVAAAEPKEEKETEIEVQEEEKEKAKEEENEVKEVEETPVEKSEKKDEKENAKEKKKPRSVKDKGKPVSEEHTSVKVKEEPTQNKVLRALMRATTEKYHVTSGKQAVQMLLTSARVKEELTLMHTFGEHLEDYQVVLCVRRWNDQVPRYPGMQFRGFVHKKRLTALSQYDDMVYIPNIIRFKSTIQKKILSFFNAHVKRAIQDHDNYLIDVFVAPNQVYLIKLSPFHTSSGACLFTWREHKELLTTTSRSIKLSVVPSPKPNCFSSLQSWWQSPLETIVQENKKVEEPQHGQRCSIL